MDGNDETAQDGSTGPEWLLPEVRGERGRLAPFHHLERFAGNEPEAAVVGVLSVEPYLISFLDPRLTTPPPGWDFVPARRLQGWAEGRLGTATPVGELAKEVDNAAWPRFLLLDGFGEPAEERGGDAERELLSFLDAFSALTPDVRRRRVVFLVTARAIPQLDRSGGIAYQTLVPLAGPSDWLASLGVSVEPERIAELTAVFGDSHNLLLQAAYRIRRHGGDLDAALDSLLAMPGVENQLARRLQALGRPPVRPSPAPPLIAETSDIGEGGSIPGTDGVPPLAKPASDPTGSATATEPPAPVPEPPVGRFLALGSTVTATDQLNRQGLVEALAAMLEDPQQETPLTIALLGDWGSGKSTLMALLRKRLDEGRPRRFCFADFNAWEYELTDNMAAGLAQEVVVGLTDDTRLGGRLARWLSPAFWWLFGRFVVARHGWRLLGWAALAAGALWLVREHDSLLSLVGIEIDADVLEIAGVAGSLVVLFYLFRGAKHILEHPFAIGLKTYLRLPRYEQHLGLVPVIKREVETLARLWLGRTWAQHLVVRSLPAPDRRGRFGRFFDRWSRPRRLVVFVDDLDRCSHARIGQTLDAIRLVMDVPQVVVVLGIDPRIAFQAMALQYEDFAEPQRSKEEIARDYLGKIIQVPIRLRRPSPDELDGFVSERLFAGATASSNDDAGNATVRGGQAAATVHIDGSTGPRGSEGATSPVGASVLGGTGSLAARPFDASVSTPGSSAAPAAARSLRLHLAEVMRPDDKEREIFQGLVRAFGFYNPRQLIRLFNSYSLLKLFAATRRAAGEPEASRDRLMRTLFVEELVHESPAPLRQDLEAALASVRPRSGLSPDLAARVAAVRSLPALGRSVIGDRAWRDFVRLVVLPAAADDSAPKPTRRRGAAGEAGDGAGMSEHARRPATGKRRKRRTLAARSAEVAGTEEAGRPADGEQSRGVDAGLVGSSPGVEAHPARRRRPVS